MRALTTVAATATVAALLAVPPASAAPGAAQTPVSAETRVYHLTWTLSPCSTISRFEIDVATHRWTFVCAGGEEPSSGISQGTYTQEGAVTEFKPEHSEFDLHLYALGNAVDTRYVGYFYLVIPGIFELVPGFFVLNEI
jgi:hypothetical protein